MDAASGPCEAVFWSVLRERRSDLRRLSVLSYLANIHYNCHASWVEPLASCQQAAAGGASVHGTTRGGAMIRISACLLAIAVAVLIASASILPVTIRRPI